MPDQVFEYPFPSLRPGILSPYVPIVILNPITLKSQPFFALLDSGADSCLFPCYIPNTLGCNLKSGKSGKASGIGSGDLETWRHNFKISLLHPNRKDVIWDSGTRGFDCTDRDDLPPILGTLDFLQYFKITFDYKGKKTIIEL